MVKKQIIVGVLLVLGISLLLTGVYYGSRIESLQVTEVEIVGGKTIPHTQIETLTRETFTGTHFKLVPKSFSWTFPDSAIKEKLQALDRVKNVKVEREGQHVVTVIYDEHLPSTLWCETHDTKECLFLDSKGFAFAEAPPLEGSAFVRFVESNNTPEKGAQAFSEEFISPNIDFITQLEDELSLYVTHIEKLGDYDIEYSVSGGGKIKVSQTIDLEKSFNSEEFAHIEPGAFQYIDLRFGDKVFVNEELPSTEISTSTASTTE